MWYLCVTAAAVWVDKFKLARRYLVCVLSMLQLQLKSHTGSWLKTLPCGLSLSLSSCGCIVSNIQPVFWFCQERLRELWFYSSEYQMYPLLLEGAVKCCNEYVQKNIEQRRTDSGVRINYLMLSGVVLSILILWYSRIWCLSLATPL